MADIVKRVDGLYTRREPWNWEPIKIALQNHNFTQYAISAFIDTFPANWSAQIAKIVDLAQATIIYQDYKASPEGQATGSIQRIAWLTKMVASIRILSIQLALRRSGYASISARV
jgi:hypothetical protein